MKKSLLSCQSNTLYLMIRKNQNGHIKNIKTQLNSRLWAVVVKIFQSWKSPNFRLNPALCPCQEEVMWLPSMAARAMKISVNLANTILVTRSQLMHSICRFCSRSLSNKKEQGEKGGRRLQESRYCTFWQDFSGHGFWDFSTSVLITCFSATYFGHSLSAKVKKSCKVSK